MKRNSLPGAESEPVMRRNSLTAQFTRLLVGAGLACFLLFAVLRMALGFGINYYAQNSDFRQRETARRMREFQAFVSEEHLASSDAEEITIWVRQQDYTLLELYRDQVLVYSSFVPDRDDIGREGKPTPFYDWMPRAGVTFADGELQALLYYDPVPAGVPADRAVHLPAQPGSAGDGKRRFQPPGHGAGQR